MRPQFFFFFWKCKWCFRFREKKKCVSLGAWVLTTLFFAHKLLYMMSRIYYVLYYCDWFLGPTIFLTHIAKSSLPRARVTYAAYIYSSRYVRPIRPLTSRVDSQDDSIRIISSHYFPLFPSPPPPPLPLFFLLSHWNEFINIIQYKFNYFA